MSFSLADATKIKMPCNRRMLVEPLKAFLEFVKSDTELQVKLKAASDIDAVMAIAKDAGFVISAKDLRMVQSEVPDEELNGANGGINHDNVT